MHIRNYQRRTYTQFICFSIQAEIGIDYKKLQLVVQFFSCSPVSPSLSCLLAHLQGICLVVALLFLTAIDSIMPCNERQIKTLRLLLVLRLASVKMAAPMPLPSRPGGCNRARGGERNKGCELSRKCRSSKWRRFSLFLVVYKRVLH